MGEMKEKQNFISEKRYNELLEELGVLKTVKRKEVAVKIREAREQGDLSENAEYDAARDEQSEIEARITELENLLNPKSLVVVKPSEVDTDSINVGCQVTLYDKDFEEEVDYLILGFIEANSLAGIISNESPLGAALLGKKVGDDIEFSTSVGTMEYTVLNIRAMD